MQHHGYRHYRTVPVFKGPVLVLVGLFLMSRGIEFWGVALIVFGLARLFRWYRHPIRGVHAQIRDDANRHGVRVPDDPVVWSSLEQVYAKYRRSTQALDALSSGYAELLASMWAELKVAQTLSEWRRITRNVVQEWPMPFEQEGSPVEASLKRLKAETKQWREARREAHSSATL